MNPVITVKHHDPSISDEDIGKAVRQLVDQGRTRITIDEVFELASLIAAEREIRNAASNSNSHR